MSNIGVYVKIINIKYHFIVNLIKVLFCVYKLNKGNISRIKGRP